MACEPCFSGGDSSATLPNSNPHDAHFSFLSARRTLLVRFGLLCFAGCWPLAAYGLLQSNRLCTNQRQALPCPLPRRPPASLVPACPVEQIADADAGAPHSYITRFPSHPCALPHRSTIRSIYTPASSPSSLPILSSSRHLSRLPQSRIALTPNMDMLCQARRPSLDSINSASTRRSSNDSSGNSRFVALSSLFKKRSKSPSSTVTAPTVTLPSAASEQPTVTRRVYVPKYAARSHASNFSAPPSEAPSGRPSHAGNAITAADMEQLLRSCAEIERERWVQSYRDSSARLAAA